MSKRLVGFNFSEHMRLICEDMTSRVAALRHIQMNRVGVGFCQARTGSVDYGVFASLTPLRCENGARTTLRRGRRYTLPQFFAPDGTEYLYLINFYIPRFLQRSFKDKLTTTVHELLHISPNFDGDIRRFGGRCYAHSGSQKNFDAYAEQLASLWLAMKPPVELYDFLHEDFRSLEAKYGGIYGTKFPKVCFIRVDE